jgi:hypothetical protein
MCEVIQPLFTELVSVSEDAKKHTLRSDSKAPLHDKCANLNGKNHQDKSKPGSPFLVILTAEQARTIYCLRSASTAEGYHSKSIAGKSSLVAEMFGVSPKTIRDVWNRKTWTQVCLNRSTD